MARILIIDDDESLLTSFDYLLTAAGHTVVTAPDGAAGATLFRAAPFDLIITDIVMPNRDGIETLIALRREFVGVGVIAISGAPMSEIFLEVAKHLGAHRMLAKPISPEHLLAAVSTVLGQVGR